ncbi:predicted protein [Verticillium alfalfae VaMs.102]|uniref:Predicted protein n=1 Tax=Verticillium alfalfae (strain VaMs.102 / ATCC MYA-4576 / FGSC 10136) TaxID=526221 RepID=C9S5G3_VERA1|nr:predicted protein [Verticillium alfalfae VaMs.102]EEY15040.1 predicted protein [Verticillium alfalfae VaMs.102]
MVSVKVLLALLPLALQATALPSPLEENHLERRVCVPPSNCSPIGNCEFCCRTGVTPNSSNCHSHDFPILITYFNQKISPTLFLFTVHSPYCTARRSALHWLQGTLAHET